MCNEDSEAAEREDENWFLGQRKLFKIIVDRECNPFVECIDFISAICSLLQAPRF